MNTYIYLIRHGEVNNPGKILYGRLPNFGLTKFGREEIEQTAEFLATKHIDMVITSPLLRARQTAGVIQKRLKISKQLIADELIEVNTQYQGRPAATLDKLQSEVYLKPLAKTDETVEQMANREEKFIRSLFAKYEGKHIVVVTHGDPAMSLQAAIEHWPLEFSSIRRGEYIQHGEVWEITKKDEKNLTLKKVFKPESHTL